MSVRAVTFKAAGIETLFSTVVAEYHIKVKFEYQGQGQNKRTIGLRLKGIFLFLIILIDTNCVSGVSAPVLSVCFPYI